MPYVPCVLERSGNPVNGVEDSDVGTEDAAIRSALLPLQIYSLTSLFFRSILYKYE